MILLQAPFLRHLIILQVLLRVLTQVRQTEEAQSRGHTQLGLCPGSATL